MKLQATKSQTIALMSSELTAMQQQCEDYQLAVRKLSRQVSALALQVQQADQCSAAREERLLQQLNDLQLALGQWQSRSGSLFSTHQHWPMKIQSKSRNHQLKIWTWVRRLH